MFIKKYILALALTLPLELVYALDVEVIANGSLTKENRIFLERNVASVFTLRSRTWRTGEPLQVYLLPKDSLYTKVFAKKYLQMTPQSYFDMLEFNQASGRGSVPIIVDSESDLVLKVLNTSGSVGYADENILFNLGNRIYIVH